MTWHLDASGDALEQLERELLDELHKVLSKPKYGALASHFAGNHVTSDVVHGSEVPQAEPEAPTQPEAAPDAEGEAPVEPEPAAEPEAEPEPAAKAAAKAKA